MTENYETKPGVRIPSQQDNLPKRFYESVTVEAVDDAFEVRLDGRGVKTPGRNAAILPTQALAKALAEEWAAQGERIDPMSMPMTRLSYVTLDRLDIPATVAEITKYASTDLLCFRAPEPDDLVAAQAAAWDPLLSWAEEALGAQLVPATGVLPIDQDPVALTLIHNRAGKLDRWRLAALAQATALTGSAVLGFALLEKRISGEQAFALSTLDEHYQASHWGEDAEAKERLDNLKIEILAVERLLDAL
ncbi:ATP12 family chaperone protein [Maricaulis sp. MIT060901]|uniref:ATP12 family chaperone protein n=1 Tax=Maricaulis sp. MIT060901 TaxID=3096993 RepID=UPI00399AE98A